MKVTPLDIRRKEFKRSMRGYADEEVDVFLDDVADEFERVFQENMELQDRIQRMEEQIAGHTQLKNALEKTLVSAQLQADQVIANARKEAELIMRDAELKARHIVEDSYGETQRVQQTLVQLKHLEEDFRFKFRSLLEGHLNLLDEVRISQPAISAREAAAEVAALEGPTTVEESIGEPISAETPAPVEEAPTEGPSAGQPAPEEAASVGEGPWPAEPPASAELFQQFIAPTPEPGFTAPTPEPGFTAPTPRQSVSERPEGPERRGAMDSMVESAPLMEPATFAEAALFVEQEHVSAFDEDASTEETEDGIEITAEDEADGEATPDVSPAEGGEPGLSTDETAETQGTEPSHSFFFGKRIEAQEGDVPSAETPVPDKSRDFEW